MAGHVTRRESTEGNGNGPEGHHWWAFSRSAVMVTVSETPCRIGVEFFHGDTDVTSPLSTVTAAPKALSSTSSCCGLINSCGLFVLQSECFMAEILQRSALDGCNCQTSMHPQLTRTSFFSNHCDNFLFPLQMSSMNRPWGFEGVETPTIELLGAPTVNCLEAPIIWAFGGPQRVLRWWQKAAKATTSNHSCWIMKSKGEP